MKKKAMNKLNVAVLFVWFLSASAVDSESWIPWLICLAASIWLLCFLKPSEGGDR